MASIRNRTVRKSPTDVSGSPIDFSVNESLQRLIDFEAESAYKKPWHRLERGLRLNRLRIFVTELAEKRGFKESESAALLQLLTKALDKKTLNSKTAVEYDPAEEKIKEIKPLVMHQTAAGEVLFQLLEKRNAITFRKRAPAASIAAASPALPTQEAQQQP